MNSYVKHKIRQNENLSSIASRLSISEEDLKNFHNTNCGKMDKIWFSNLMGIEYILIPTQPISEKEILKTKEKLLPNKKYFLGFHASKYHVEETIEKFNENTTNITYTLDLKLEKNQNEFVSQVSLKDFKKDKILADDKISNLSLECMSLLYPLEFTISENGTLQSFFNLKNRIQNFKNKKSDLEEYYIGEISKKYIDLFEEKISNENTFFKSIKSRLLYQLLFVNLNWFHKKSSTWVDRFSIDQHHFPLQFQCISKQDFEDNQFVETKINGTLFEPCNVRELIKGFKIKHEELENDVNAEIQIQYKTDKISKQFFEVKASLIIWHEDKLYLKHQLQITKM